MRSKRNRDRDPDFSIAYEYLVNLLGDPKQEREAYEAIDPIHRVDRVKIPFFIAHGLSDSVVSAKQSRALAREFRARDIPHETFFRKFAAHGLFDAADRIAYYTAVERFLATHLAPSQ